jgi:hypothetical protein
MARRRFGGLTAPVPRRRKVLRTGVGLFLCTWWGTALCSGYRAIWQVYGVEVSAPGGVLKPGSTVRARIVTSGRTHARLDVALVQGAHAEVLASRYVASNRASRTDPRPHRAALAVVLRPDVLSRFHAGPARLRVIGFGSSQFLHVPPPKVRDVPVRIAQSGPNP